MERSIFRYILKYSKREQLLVLLMTVASFPFLYATLELPKLIINDAFDPREFPRDVYGYEFDQVGYLWLLCALFLLLVLINGGFKYVINVYRGVVGERMLRRLRFDLYSRVLRFPLAHFRRVSQGEVVQMITGEVERLGGFIGDAFALPAFQGGTLITILVFMFAQDWLMGLAAVVLYPLQIYLIPKLQKRVNELGRQRIREVRVLSDRIGEAVAGARDIRANDATAYERARFTHQLGWIYKLRLELYKRKFFIKFLNNFLSQLGPFFFFSIGGYLVIQGDLTLGALVAVIGAQKELYAPWKELLTYYQVMEEARIKYEQVVAQFDPAGMRDDRLQAQDDAPGVELRGSLRATNLQLIDDDDAVVLDGVSFSLRLPSHVAVAGNASSGKQELALVLAGLLTPGGGRVQVNEHDLVRLPDAVLGRRLAYVGYPAQIFSGSIEDNLFYGLKHRPLRPRELQGVARADWERALRDAKLAGNSAYDAEADWIDYDALGARDPEALRHAVVAALRHVKLDADVYQMGLRSSIDPEAAPELADELLKARNTLRARLQDDDRLRRLVEPFDVQRYNGNASLAENLLFGTPIGDTFHAAALAENDYVRATLERVGLTAELHAVGYKMAATMVELFADLPPDHEYFRQFSFIQPEDLPDYKALVGRADPQRLDRLKDADKQRLLALAFKLIPARHRLGLLEDELTARVLEARHAFREHLPEDLAGTVAFFDPERYNGAASIQDNVLFGKIAHGQAQAAERINRLLAEVIDDLRLREAVVNAGLAAQVGVGGSRLSLAQRQKLALARALLKRPEVLIVAEAIGPLDQSEQTEVLANVLAASEGRTVIWVLHRNDWADRFERILVLQNGRLLAEGGFDEITSDGAARKLIAAA